MKKIICLLAFSSFLASQKAFAQPTYCLSPQQVEVDQGDNVCLDLVVKNFTDIISTQFTITFDPTVLQFQSVTNLNPLVTGLDILDFGTTTGNLGYITFIWDDGQPCQSANNGVTLTDGQVLFSLCFNAIGDYGFHTPVEFANSPIDRVTRRATAACFDIGEFICNSFVSIGTKPLKVNISSADGKVGDVVCIDFKVEDFNDLISAQYFVFWDTSVLEYFSAITQTLGSSGDVYQVNYSPAFGMLASVWYSSSVNNGVTLPDGSQILQVCFKIKGNCGQSSPIYISETNSTPPEPIEIIDAVTANNPSGVNIGLLQTQGTVTVNCTNNPNSIGINIDDKNVCPGETFEVDIKLEDFSQIVKMMFDLKWNPAVINFLDVTYPTQPGGPACLPFSTGVGLPGIADVSTGRLHMNWETQGQGCNKADGFVMMRLKFIAVGPGGSNSTISVVDSIFVDKFGGQPVNIGININNALVTLCDTNKPTLVVGSQDANPGSTVCLDVNVQDFNDLTSMSYTLSWNESKLQFTGIQGLNLSNLSLPNFDVSQTISGYLTMDWSSPTGVTVPDGVSIFKLCFKVLGDPGDCSDIVFSGLIEPIVVENTNQTAGNVGLNGQPGKVCVLDPFILHLSLPDVYGGQNSTVCVDLTAEQFNQMTKTNYTIFWDGDVLDYDTIISTGALPSFGPSSYDVTNTGNGYLNIQWNAANQVLGASVPNGTSLFKICFTIIGAAGECSPLTIASFPAQNPLIRSATTGNSNLNLISTAGSVCVGGSISLLSYVVNDVTCGANPDGAIDVTVGGGSGSYTYQWTGPGVNPTVADQMNLNVGYYTVTITDALNPQLTIIQPFSVVYSANATYANAGQDTTRSCNTNELILNGSGSSMTPNNTYLWQSLGFGLVLPGEETKKNPQIIGSGLFKLTVTGTNCVDSDTVFVGGTQTPIPHIEPADFLSCKKDTVALDGTLSPFGFDIMWTGPAVVAGTENDFIAKATAPGWYFMTMSNSATNCVGVDSILVLADLMPPVADAGVDTVLGCVTTIVPIGGTSSTGPSIMYDWVPVGNGQFCGNPQAATLNACSPGIFELTVLDTLNGCSAMDMVVVTGDTLKPISNAGADKTLTCLIDTVTLDGTGSSTGTDFTYTWTLLGTIVAQGSASATVSTPGTYVLEVMDNSNNCSAVSEVEVIDAKTPPASVASHSNDISCLITTDTLDATGSAVGANISYEWFSGSTSVGTGLTTVVNAPGIYQLVVTNSVNQCTSTKSVTVGDLTTPPVSEAGNSDQLDCNGPAMLQGTFDSSNSALLPQWSGPGQGCIQSPNSPSTTVTCAGVYYFNVYNSTTGCVGFDSVTVTEDKVKPIANAGPNKVLPCLGSSIMLDGSTNVANYSVTWTSSPAGLSIQNPTTLMPTITQPGTYFLVVTSNDNGCMSTSSLVMVTLSPSSIIADAGLDMATNCQNMTVTLDGSGSTTAGNTILWQKLDGTFVSNQIIVPNVPAGVYELVITKTGGCEARDTVSVIDDIESFTATIPTAGNISCDNPCVDLTGTSTSTGTNLTYIWTNENGMIVGNGENISVCEAGNYTLTVTNTANGCSASTKATVVQNNPNLEPATAQADYANCEADAMLIGNQPAGTTGNWTSLTTGTDIENPALATTIASGFSAGEYIFVYTLSLGDCLNYSKDTVTILVNNAMPNAVNDNTTLQPGTGGQISFNVLENDEIFGGVKFTLLPNNVFGEVVSNDAGLVTFTKEKCVSGKVEIPYQICDLGCPDLCDQAILTIEVVSDPDEACGETPNGITPNGDGVNDELVFDELLNNDGNYPDNEFIVFNRWGDIVYQVKPYLNNWNGKSNKGDELPHATYYYILRLNISDGKILKGDVTILK